MGKKDTTNHDTVEKTLTQLNTYLTENGLVCKLALPEGDMKQSYLLIYLGKDGKERDQVLQLNFLLMPTPEEVGVKSFPFGPEAFLQFVCVLPFKVAKKNAGEVLRFFAQLNASIEIPGFGYNEVLEQVHFRYVHYSYHTQIDKGLLFSLIVYVRSVIDLFGGWAEDIAKGELTVEQVAAKAVKEATVMQGKRVEEGVGEG